MCAGQRLSQGLKLDIICVCVVLPFILDVRLVAYQPGSHRRKVTQDFSTLLLRRACLILSREKDSAVPFPHRP